MFAGCKLKESIKISSILNLINNDDNVIFFVYIPSIEDTLLMTFVARRPIDYEEEYEYTYYYSDDDDIKNVQLTKENKIIDKNEKKINEKNINEKKINFSFLDQDLIDQIKPQLKIKNRLLGGGVSSFVYKVNCIDESNQYNEECKNFLALKIIKKSFCEEFQSFKPKSFKKNDDDDDDDGDDDEQQ